MPNHSTVERASARFDSDLVSKAADLLAKNSQDIRKRIMRSIRDPEDAKDMLQEVSLKVIRAVQSGRGPADECQSQWIATVVRNQVHDYYRARARNVRTTPLEGSEFPYPESDPPGSRFIEDSENLTILLARMRIDERLHLLYKLAGISGEVARDVEAWTPEQEQDIRSGWRKRVKHYRTHGAEYCPDCDCLADRFYHRNPASYPRLDELTERVGSQSAIAMAREVAEQSVSRAVYVSGDNAAGKTSLLLATVQRAVEVGRAGLYVSATDVISRHSRVWGWINGRSVSRGIVAIDDAQAVMSADPFARLKAALINIREADWTIMLASTVRPGSQRQGVDSLNIMTLNFDRYINLGAVDNLNSWMLDEMAERRNIRLSEDVVDLVMSRSRGRRNELQRMLDCLAEFNRPNSEVDLRTATMALQLSTTVRSKVELGDDLIEAVAEECHVTRDALTGPSRARTTADARHLAMYLLRTELNMSLREIGEFLGGRDPSSVAHAVRKIENMLRSSARPSGHLARIRSSIRGRLRRHDTQAAVSGAA